jgi:hypothetical protein
MQLSEPTGRLSAFHEPALCWPVGAFCSCGMQNSPEPMIVLEYGHPTASGLRMPWWLWLFGAVPFAIEFVALMHEAATGDPPTSLWSFKAYHYATGLAVLLATAWFLLVVRLFYKRRHRPLLLVCGAWFAWVVWMGFLFIEALHQHPAGKFYWSAW